MSNTEPQDSRLATLTVKDLLEWMVKSGYTEWPDNIREAAAEMLGPRPETDAELREEFQRELGKGWAVLAVDGDFCCFVRHGSGILAYPTYAALRQHGPAEIARCLKKIAGLE